MNKLNQLKHRLRYKIFSIFFKSRIKSNVTRGEQLLLSQLWKKFHADKNPLPDFKDIGFQEYSGTDEDGILLYLFSLLGTKNKILVDIGCATPYGSNSANLILNHQWTGLLLDGSDEAINLTTALYASYPMVRNYPPKAICSFVTAENINSLISDNDIEGEIDLLSIDIDGVDYWVWKAINIINPRVVIVEYQPVLGSECSLTVPYEENFYRHDYAINSDPTKIVYAGASLVAFNKLAKQKGYTLVACNSQEFNAFFVRNDINDGVFPEKNLPDCFLHPRTKDVMNEFYSKVKEMPWEEV